MRYKAYILGKDLHTTGEVIECDDLRTLYRNVRYQVRVEKDWCSGAYLYDSTRALTNRIFAVILNINEYKVYKF